MNLFEAEDMAKGLPDARLAEEMQNPTGQLPQYIVLSEMSRRKRMRDSSKASQAGQQDDMTIAQRMTAETMGLGQPQQQMPQQRQGFASGGRIGFDSGGYLSTLTPQDRAQFIGRSRYDALNEMLGYSGGLRRPVSEQDWYAMPSGEYDRTQEEYGKQQALRNALGSIGYVPGDGFQGSPESVSRLLSNDDRFREIMNLYDKTYGTGPSQIDIARDDATGGPPPATTGTGQPNPTQVQPDAEPDLDAIGERMAGVLSLDVGVSPDLQGQLTKMLNGIDTEKGIGDIEARFAELRKNAPEHSVDYQKYVDELRQQASQTAAQGQRDATSAALFGLADAATASRRDIGATLRSVGNDVLAVKQEAMRRAEQTGRDASALGLQGEIAKQQFDVNRYASLADLSIAELDALTAREQLDNGLRMDVINLKHSMNQAGISNSFDQQRVAQGWGQLKAMREQLISNAEKYDTEQRNALLQVARSMLDPLLENLSFEASALADQSRKDGIQMTNGQAAQQIVQNAIRSVEAALGTSGLFSLGNVTTSSGQVYDFNQLP